MYTIGIAWLKFKVQLYFMLNNIKIMYIKLCVMYYIICSALYYINQRKTYFKKTNIFIIIIVVTQTHLLCV